MTGHGQLTRGAFVMKYVTSKKNSIFRRLVVFVWFLKSSRIELESV